MLLRSSSETFNPQIHTEELSLTTQMDKKMAVHNKVISRFERYTKLTSFLFHTGRVDGGVRSGMIKRPSASQEVNDNAYRVKYRSINIRPAVSMGAVVAGGLHDPSNSRPNMSAIAGVTYVNGKDATTMTTDTLVSFAIKHDPTSNIYGDKFNPTDSVSLQGGLGALIIITSVRRADDDTHYVIDGKVVAKEITDWDEASFDEDEVFMEGGNYQGEGSMKGYQRHQTNYWKIFYSFISRYSLSFTGNSLRQKKVIWTGDTAGTANKSGGYWQYEQEWFADEMFAIFLELACRFSISSMDPSTHSWYENFGKNQLTQAGFSPSQGITPPKTPDGWVQQIKGTIDLTYDVNDGFSTYLLESVGNVLFSNSPAGSQGNTIMVVGDGVAYDNWDRAMKRLIGWNTSNGGSTSSGAVHNTNIVQNVQHGQKVKLGFGVECYYYKGNEFIFVQDELFSHPGLNNRSGGLVGNGNMYFINVTMFDGVSNFELFSGGKGRFFKKKYVDGMHSLDPKRDNSNYASSGFDGAFCHYLAELFPIIYVEDTCAVIRGVNRFAGGALSGNASINQYPLIK